MGIYKDKISKKWYYEFSYKTSTGERKRRKQRGFDLKKEAVEAENYEKVKLKETPPSKITFSQLYKLYTEAKSPEWLPGTERKFETAMRLHILPFFQEMKIDDIASKDIEDWKTAMYDKLTDDGTKYHPKTLNRFKGDLNALFNYAVNHRFINFNPARVVSSFKNPAMIQRPEKEVWSDDEFKAFISVVDDERWRLFFLFMWCTGVRIGEMQGIMFEDIDFENKTVRINKSIDTKQAGQRYVINPTKTKKVRVLELPESFLKELKPYYEYQKQYNGWNKKRFLFGFENPMSNTTVDVARGKYIALAKVKYISSHCFRHSHATMLLSNGVDIKSVSERLGHKDVAETLNTYAHVLPNNRDKILNLITKSIKVTPI